MFIIQISDDRMQEMARDVGRVTNELKLLKAVSKREATERPSGPDGMLAKAEMFDIGEGPVRDEDWEFTPGGGSSSSSGSSIRTEESRTVKKEAGLTLVPRKR